MGFSFKKFRGQNFKNHNIGVCNSYSEITLYFVIYFECHEWHDGVVSLAQSFWPVTSFFRLCVEPWAETAGGFSFLELVPRADRTFSDDNDDERDTMDAF